MAPNVRFYQRNGRTNKDKLCKARRITHGEPESSEVQKFEGEKSLGQIANRCTRCHISAAGSRQIGRAVAELFRHTLVDEDKYRVFRRLFPFCTCFTEFSHNLSHFLVRARLFINLMSPAHASDGTQTTLPS